MGMRRARCACCIAFDCPEECALTALITAVSGRLFRPFTPPTPDGSSELGLLLHLPGADGLMTRHLNSHSSGFGNPSAALTPGAPFPAVSMADGVSADQSVLTYHVAEGRRTSVGKTLPAPHEDVTVRVVIAGEDGTALTALEQSIERLPGVAVIARLTDLISGWAYCQRGDADVLIVEAAELAGGHVSRPMSDAAQTMTMSFRVNKPAGGDPRPGAELVDEIHLASLSARERQVFRMLVTGPSNRQLSRSLGITERTVKAHIGSIMTKLGLESRLQVGLAAYAYHASPAAEPAGRRADPLR